MMSSLVIGIGIAIVVTTVVIIYNSDEFLPFLFSCYPAGWAVMLVGVKMKS